MASSFPGVACTREAHLTPERGPPQHPARLRWPRAIAPTITLATSGGTEGPSSSDSSGTCGHLGEHLGVLPRLRWRRGWSAVGRTTPRTARPPYAPRPGTAPPEVRRRHRRRPERAKEARWRDRGPDRAGEVAVPRLQLDTQSALASRCARATSGGPPQRLRVVGQVEVADGADPRWDPSPGSGSGGRSARESRPGHRGPACPPDRPGGRKRRPPVQSRLPLPRRRSCSPTGTRAGLGESGAGRSRGP